MTTANTLRCACKASASRHSMPWTTYSYLQRAHAGWCAQDTDENKLIYTDIFAKYTALVESTIDRKLKAAVPGFEMQVMLCGGMNLRG